MDVKICSKCKKELPLTRDYFTVNNRSKDGFHNNCKICRGFSSYGISLPRENAELKKSGLKRCKYCREIKPIEIYKQVGKTRLCEFCPDCESRHKREKSEYDNKYFQLNKEYKKEYYNKWKDNGGRYIRNINEQNRRTKIKSNENTLTIDEWNECLQYFDNSCAYCGANNIDILSQDHVIPVSNGGGYVKNNIVPACKSCNSSKINKPLIDFYKYKDSFTYDKYTKVLNWIKLN